MATATGTDTYRLKAVIDVGSTSIRMVVAQLYDDGSFESLDSLSQSVAIGNDAFTRGRISRSTVEDAVKVLRNFSSVLSEYQIDLSKDVRAVATSAVREARNRDEFLDRVYMATGIHVEVIEGTEVNRLTFLAIQPVLNANKELQKQSLLVVEVGGGSTELLGLEDGRVSFAHTYRLGSYRLRESMGALNGSAARQLEVLDLEIDAGVRQMRDVVRVANNNLKLLLMGGEARFTARLLAKDGEASGLAQFRVADLEKLAEKMICMDVDKIVRQHHLTFEEAQAWGPALRTFVCMAKAFGLKKVFMCLATLRDGLVAEAAYGSAWSADFVEQILHSVHELGRRYNLDENHAGCVTENALALFHSFADEHQLDDHYEVLLTVAAQLHEIGMFIGSSGHHKHSQYLIENSEIFGLGEEDIKLTALVARYHRRATPKPSHSDYSSLSREKRLVVVKLAAILRVADALDRSHTQSVRNIGISKKGNQLIVEVDRPGEYAAEKRALVSKGGMFEQIYGRTVVLRSGRKRG